jgi:hypothetical protein
VISGYTAWSSGAGRPRASRLLQKPFSLDALRRCTSCRSARPDRRGPRKTAGAASGQAAEDDQAVRRVVRGDRDGHTVSGNHANVVAPHPSPDLGEELHAVVALHSIVATGECLDDGALDLDEVVASQGGGG